MKNKIKNPPKIAQWLLKTIANKNNNSAIIGDLEEEYYQKIKSQGTLLTLLWYWSLIFISLPSFLTNMIYWRTTMFKNYLKIALRNIYKNKLHSFINVFGLGIAVACCIFGDTNFTLFRSWETFHENHDKIHAVQWNKYIQGEKNTWSYIPMPMAQAIKDNVPGIENVTRFTKYQMILSHEDKVFEEQIGFADEHFFDIFTFPLEHGSSGELNNKNGIILSENIANKYFGDDNPIGKQMTITYNGDKLFDFIVTGVAKNVPYNTILQWSVMVSIENLEELFDWNLNDWKYMSKSVFIQLADQVSPALVEEQLQAFKQIVVDKYPDWEMERFTLAPLNRIAYTMINDGLHGDPFNNGVHAAMFLVPSITAIIILLLACFNFVNISIAAASRRFKEIGIRKIFGGLKRQLVIQFFSENLILCFIALTVGILFANLFIGFYSHSIFTAIPTDFLYNSDFPIFIIVLLFLTGIIAGVYPAIIVSRLKPIQIFKKRQIRGHKNKLRYVLIVLQMTFSIIFFATGIIFIRNAQFITSVDLGFKKNQIINVAIWDKSNYETFKNAIQNHPNISHIAATSDLFGDDDGTESVMKANEETFRGNLFFVGENYLQTLNLHLIDGRLFNHNLKTDFEDVVVVNEQFMNHLGWTSIKEKYMRVSTGRIESEFKIIGVVKDFKYQGVSEKVNPAAIKLSNPEWYEYLTFRYNNMNNSSAMEYARNEWKSCFPELPFNAYYQDEFQSTSLRNSYTVSKFYLGVASIVVVLVVMGLFALVSLKLEKKTKEIAIRKVLGASLRKISLKISNDIIGILIISSILALILSYFMSNAFLGSIYAYHTDFNISPILIGIILMFAITILTIISKIINAGLANPADSLRHE